MTGQLNSPPFETKFATSNCPLEKWHFTATGRARPQESLQR